MKITTRTDWALEPVSKLVQAPWSRCACCAPLVLPLVARTPLGCWEQRLAVRAGHAAHLRCCPVDESANPKETQHAKGQSANNHAGQHRIPGIRIAIVGVTLLGTETIDGAQAAECLVCRLMRLACVKGKSGAFKVRVVARNGSRDASE